MALSRQPLPRVIDTDYVSCRDWTEHLRSRRVGTQGHAPLRYLTGLKKKKKTLVPLLKVNGVRPTLSVEPTHTAQAFKR